MLEIRHEDTRISFAISDSGLLVHVGHRDSGFAITLTAGETEQLISALTPMVPALKENEDKAKKEAEKKAIATLQAAAADHDREAIRLEKSKAEREAFKAELRAEILAEMQAAKLEDGEGR